MYKNPAANMELAGRRELGRDLFDAVMADFASDADAGVAFLKTRTEVDPHQTGLVRNGEGAIEALLPPRDVFGGLRLRHLRAE